MRERKVTASVDANVDRFDKGMAKAADALDRFRTRIALVANNAPAGMRKLNSSVQALAPTFQRVGYVATAMGTAITGAFTAATVAAGAYADEISDFAMTFGESTSDVRALNDVLGKSDVQLQQFGNAAIGVVDKLDQARQGNEEAAAAFAKLGLSLSDLDGKSAIDVMGAVGDALRQIEDQQERINLAKALGLSGRTLKAAIMAAGSGVAAQKQDATFITDEQYQRLQEVSDALDELGVKAGNTWKKAFAEAAPTIISLIGYLNNLLDWISRFVDANPKLAGAIGTGMAAFGALASAIGPVLIAIAPLVQIMTTLSGAGGIGGLVSGLTKAIPLLGTISGALAGIALPAATAVAALTAVVLVWRDMRVAIEAVTAALDAYKTRQGTKDMLTEAGVSEKDARRMMRDDQAVDVSKMRRRGIRDQIQAEQRRQAGMTVPAMAAGGFVKQATLALVGEAGPEAVVPLTDFGSMLAILSRIAARFEQPTVPMTGAVRGGAVTVNVSGLDQQRVVADVGRMARQWGATVARAHV